MRALHIDPKADEEDVSEDEIRMMVDLGEERGAIESNEKELIDNIFEFNNTTAEDVMIHRTDMVMLWVEDTREEILATIRSSGLSRFPVYEENADDIIGILSTREYLLNAQAEAPKPMRELLRPAYFVPELQRTPRGMGAGLTAPGGGNARGAGEINKKETAAFSSCCFFAEST